MIRVYYNQKCSIAQAYDIAINGLDEPRELPKPRVELNKMEIISGYNIVEEIKATTKKDKVIVVQPFGRSVQQMGEFIADPTSRSMSLVGAIDIINQLKKDYAVIVMSEHHFATEENEDKYPIARPQIQDTVKTVKNRNLYTQTAAACKQPRRFRQIFLPAGV